MTIFEPWTLATDYLLTVLAAWLAWRLYHQVPVGNRAARWWGHTLMLTALSAFVGGTSHGFGPNLPPAAASALWLATLWALSLVAGAMAVSLVHECVPQAKRRLWAMAIALKLWTFLVVAAMRPIFVVAIADYGLALMAWLVAALVLRRAWRGWMLGAIALSVVAAGVQQSGWAPSVRFNHNDLYHVIQAGALYLFYRAARDLGATTASR